MTTTTITQDSTITTANADATVAYPIATCDQPVVTIRLNITSKRQTSLLSILNKRMGSGKQSIPALNYASASATASGIMITGADMSLMMPGQGFIDDEVTFMLNDVLSRLDGEVELSAGTMKSSNSTISYYAFPLNELPAPVDYRHNFVARLRFQGVELSQKLSMITPSMAKDDVRYYLNGVCFAIENGKLNLVSTDGHRLAMTTVDVVSHDSLSLEQHQFIIKNEDVVILQLLLKHSPTVTVAFFDEYAEFRGDDWTLVCKYIDGRYPDWQTVIPRDEQMIKLSRDNMTDLLHSLKNRKATKFNAVTISIDAMSYLIVTTRAEFSHQERLEVTDRIDLDYEDQPTIDEMGFNRKYLINMLEVAIKAGVNVATFGFTNVNSSISVRFDDFIGVVMPMRI